MRTDEGLSDLVERNIRALVARREREEAALGWQARIAAGVSRFVGSMPFVWLHLAFYGAWIVVNAGLLPVLPRFDPSFVTLAMIASVEAIFLSTFILITQNRMQVRADRRAELDLQISLLAEHEITRLVAMVAEIGRKVGVENARDPHLAVLERDVDAEVVLDAIERHERGTDAAKPAGGSG